MKKPLRYAIFAAIAVVVIGISAAVAIFLNLQNESAKKQEGQLQSTPRADPAVKKADDAGKLAYEGNLQAGLDLLDASIKNSTDNREKSILYSQKGILLLENKKYDDALVAAKQALELEKTVDGAAFVGQIARQKGDKALALEYYEKALALIDAEGSPMAEDDTKYYKGIIAELEKTA